MELNPEQSSDDGTDSQDSDYYDYRSKTRLGSRYDTVIALYGAVNPWTLYCYWFKDSILKQTIMLLDKSGLRKKSKSSQQNMQGKGVIEASSQEEIDNALGAFTSAYQQGELNGAGAK